MFDELPELYVLILSGYFRHTVVATYYTILTLITKLLPTGSKSRKLKMVVNVRVRSVVMIVGVFSDVHDNLDNLRKALEIFKANQAECLIFCGDFCSPIPARVMGEAFAGDIHVVFGNGDGDRFAISNVANTTYPNLNLHGEHAELDLAGNKVAVTHYPFYAQALARTGDYQAVFSGHTHQLHEERIGDCLWLNPGEVLGWQGQATCALYDTVTNTATIVSLA